MSKCIPQVIQDNLGQVDRTSSGVGLWRADPQFTARQLDHNLPELDHAVDQDDLAPLQASPHRMCPSRRPAQARGTGDKAEAAIEQRLTASAT
jgi:hypothetical protein